MSAFFCVLLYVCSHMCAPLVLVYMWSHRCALICVLLLCSYLSPLLLLSMCSHKCALLRLLSDVPSYVCCHMCAFICVPSYVCSQICAFICVLSYVCSPMCFHMCALICVLLYACTHMCAFICVLSYLCSSCALIYVLSYVCSHMRAIIFVLVLCSHMCALTCVLSSVCSDMCVPIVLSYMCSLMCALLCVPSYVCAHCAHICVLFCCCVLVPIPPTTLFGVSCRNNLTPFTSKCASRHNGAPFFISLIWPAGSAPIALARLLSTLRSHKTLEKTQCFATFLPFRAPASSLFWLSPSLISLPCLSFLLAVLFHLSILSEVSFQTSFHHVYAVWDFWSWRSSSALPGHLTVHVMAVLLDSYWTRTCFRNMLYSFCFWNILME